MTNSPTASTGDAFNAEPTPDWGGRFDLPYRILSGDDADERACEAIPDGQCTAVPRNFTLNALNGACSKLAEQLASPGLTLPWLLTAAGAPAAFATVMPAVKQAFSLAPQMLVAGAIRGRPTRKKVWVAAGAVQAAAMAGLALAATSLNGLAAGVAAVALFALFSVMSGAASVAFQDVMGKTIPKGRRGRLLATRAAIGGALVLVAAAALKFGVEDGAALALPLVLGAAALWVGATLAFALIEEAPGATGGGRSMAQSLAAGFAAMRENRPYNRFVKARALLLSVELAMPVYALHAVSLYGQGAGALAVMLFAVGLANIVSSPLWGRLSDAASETVMTLAALAAVAAAALALAIHFLIGGAPGWSLWLYGLVFVLLGVAEAGVRLGRKTYLVDGAPKEEKALYAAFANSAVGLIALAALFVGVLVDAAGAPAGVAAAGALALIAALYARSLPPAADMARAAGED
ncbi:MAG: MFS transporter [Alphaproteobacteria bacterium]|nr:MFS transporter [Alphaproteobacteria bacterium]